MNDDPRLDELAAQALDAADAAILAEVRELYGTTDQVPADLVERVNFSLALDEMFDEVARMTRVPMDSLAVRGEATGTRTETLTFSADRLTAMVTVSRVGPGQLRLDGWLAPPGAWRVRLRLQGKGEREREEVADEQGRFSFEGLAEGFGQLSFHPVDDDAAENAVVTPLFQL
jgi:hypothetical protein